MIPFLATHLTRLSGRYFPDLLCRLHEQEKVVYLTFDDGPTADGTPRLMALLERFGAQATFFAVGTEARRDPGLVRALHDAGHTLGNHTDTHPDPWATPLHTLLAELERTTGTLEDLVGERIRWMRPPWGRFNKAMRAWCLARRQQLTLWDVMPGDYLPTATAASVRAHLEQYIRPGSIVVLHDNPRTTHLVPEALAPVLERMTDEGWRFAALPAR